MRHILLLAGIAPQAFVNTHAGNKFYVCVTPEDADLDATAFAALTWVQVKGVGNLGETGSKTNILSYTQWDTDTVQKSKGTTDAGSPTLEVARISTDAGQIALRSLALTNHSYAFRIVGNDPLTQGGTPTIRYNRGIITGPTHPNGKNEDFDLEMFTFGMNQREIIVEPT